MKAFTFIVLLILLSFLSACTVKDEIKIITDNGEVKLLAERALTPEQREKGLMFRESLAKNAGMLFVFEEPIKPSFWMKNILIPLDILFIDENFIIVDFIESMQPCRQEPCGIYSSDKYAKYALEVNAGFVRGKGVNVGNKVVV